MGEGNWSIQKASTQPEPETGPNYEETRNLEIESFNKLERTRDNTL